MSTPFCVSPPNLAHRTKKHRKTCSKHRSPPLTFLPAVTPPHLMYSSVGPDDSVRPNTRLPHPHFVLILSFRASAHTGVGIRIPVSCQQRPKAATYLCRFAAKARFDNRLKPQGKVSKGEGSQPLPFGRFKGKRFLRKGGNRNPPFLKWRSLVTFFRQGKKVTRRRQKKEVRDGQSRPPLHTSTENPCAIYPGGCGHPPLRNHRQARASSIRRDEVIAPYEKGRR